MKEKKIQLREKDHAHRKENIWAKEVFSNGQQSLKSIMGSSPIPAFIIGKDHLIIYWNKALEELSGIKAQEVVGTGQHWRAFYKTARPCMADLLVERRQKDIQKWYGEKFIKSRLIAGAYEATDFFPELGKKGKWLRFTAATIRNARGSVVGAVETLEDITHGKRAEEALLRAHQELERKVKERTLKLAQINETLKETTDHLSLILEFLPIVSFTSRLDDHWSINYVSKKSGKLPAIPPRSLQKAPFLAGTHSFSRSSRCEKKMQSVTNTPKETCQMEYRFRTIDGSYRWISDHRRLIRQGRTIPAYMVGAWQDITEEKRIRQEAELHLQQMIQSHKLKALGEVVAGVAHEINNPVSFIANNITLLEDMWNTVEPILASDGASHPDWSEKGVGYVEVCTNMKEIINEFKIASQRIKRVILGLKEFARTDETLEKRPVRVEEVIRGVMIIVGAQIRKTVSNIDLYIDSHLPPIQGHFQKIEQVIANLLINAHQAIPPGRKGRIIVTARKIERLGAVLIEIEDNGSGMDKEVLDHIFEPFFTTRRATEGTGLGLSISYGLIKEHHGLIGVLSRPNVGSKFSVYLPFDFTSRIHIRPAILCCDSNTARLHEIMMSCMNVMVWKCGPDDTYEDLVTYLENYPEVDIVVSEVSLPSMNGWELSRRIKERFPLMTVILYASASGERKTENMTVDSGDYLIDPFNLSSLRNIIHEVERQRL